MVEWPSLRLDVRGELCSNTYVFVKCDRENDIAPSTKLPSIEYQWQTYYMIPSTFEFPKRWTKVRSVSDREVLSNGRATFPIDAYELPSDEEITQEIDQYLREVCSAKRRREAREVTRRAESDLYASSVWIADETPMLVEGLMRENGVSVFYGAFDEFKTTLVLDIMAHVACGANWQGRKVKPRPVIWYALEGGDEIPTRLRALERRLRNVEAPWGRAPLPITVRDRIPDDYTSWRVELYRLTQRWADLFKARVELDELPIGEGEEVSDYDTLYPEPGTNPDGNNVAPIVVIDTLSIALGGEDEKGPGAASFIQNCLDLMKLRPDLEPPDTLEHDYNIEERDRWQELNGYKWDEYLDYPVASHVIVIHHQTKTGSEIAGHRAIAADTHGLYRVHRFGRLSDNQRPYAGQLTPMRTKGIARPSPIRFEVDVVPVEDTQQTAVVIKNKAADIPAEFQPVIAAFRELEDQQEISSAILNECLDTVAARPERTGAAKRQARKRILARLLALGIVEPIENADSGRVEFYRLHATTI